MWSNEAQSYIDGECKLFWLSESGSVDSGWIEVNRAIGLLDGCIEGIETIKNFNKEGVIKVLKEVKQILEDRHELSDKEDLDEKQL